jgi:hypothetical protein
LESSAQFSLFLNCLTGAGILAECLHASTEVPPIRRCERKVRLALPLRAETTMSLQWIAEPLGMGSWTRVSNLLGATRKQESLNSEN